MKRIRKRRAASAVLSIVAVLATATVFMGTASAAPTPQVQVGDGAIVEGGSGRPIVLKLPLTLSEPAGSDVTVEWTLSGATASAGTDFKARPKPGKTKIRAGKVGGQISVQVFPDTAVEGNETFEVALTRVISGPVAIGDRSIGTGTIIDDDPAGVTVGIGDITTVGTLSGQTKTTVPLTLSEVLPSSNVEVTWTASGGTALPGSDFKALSKPKKTTIKAGKTKANATITIYSNTGGEPDESFYLTITNVNVTGTPVAVATMRSTSVVTIKAVTNGEVTPSNLFSFGEGYSGSLASGSDAPRLLPETVSSSLDWSTVASANDHALGIKSDGTLWGWGETSGGQLGFISELDRFSPVQIGTDRWTAVATGLYHSIAIRSDGTLWSWGLNSEGQLGTGVPTGPVSFELPAQVGVDSDWAAVATHGLASFGLKTDGTLWSWGYNWFGQLGLGDTFRRTTPERIGTDDDWAEITSGNDYTFGRKTDGTLWGWGLNGVVGLLGIGDTTNYLEVPTQVGTDTDWATVAAGGNTIHAAAVKSDGTLWAWGWNGDGQLGLGDTTDRLVPTQVGSDTDWASVSVASSHTMAIKVGGTLWSWGLNSAGQLGTGDYISRNTPGQVGTDSDWGTIETDQVFTLALKR